MASLMTNTDLSLQSEIRKLQESPTSQEIQTILQTYLSLYSELSIATDVKFLTTILKFIIPIHKQLSAVIRAQLRQCFTTVRSLSNLVQQAKISKAEIYLDFTKYILANDELLGMLIQKSGSSKFDLSLIGGLLFGGRILSLYKGSWEIKSYVILMISHLIKCLELNLDISGDWVLKLLYLHPFQSIEVFCKTLLTQQNEKFLAVIFKESFNQTQRIQFLTKLFIPLFLSQHLNQVNIPNFYHIMKSWDLNSIEDQLLKTVRESPNQALQQFIIALQTDKSLAFNQLLQTWSDEQYILNSTPEQRYNITIMMVFLAEKLTKDQRQTLSRSGPFLNGVTRYLELNDGKMRNYTMMLVKVITEGQVKFEVPEESDYALHRIEIKEPENGTVDFESMFEDFDNISIAVKETHQFSSSETAIDQQEDVDSDDEDYPTSASVQSDPVFLKDLILRLNSDNVQSFTHLLQIAVKLVRKKSSFIQEIQFHSEELLSLLVALNNKYDEDQFEQLKMNAIISILVTNPKSISIVLNLLFQGDFSLQQRLVILTSIGLSARELSGLKDDQVQQIDSSFPTQEIPSRKSQSCNLIQEISKPKIEEITDTGNDSHLGQGTVLRKSSKLTSPHLSKPQRTNNFSPIAHNWFYPLANVIRSEINLGSFTELFVNHYITTLKLIVDAAWPCVGWEDMKKQLEDIIIGVGNH